MAFIVIEGPDNAGKSTLLDQILSALCIPAIRPPSYNKIYDKGEQEVTKYTEWMLRDFEASKQQTIVYDRHPLISANIYEPILINRNSILLNERYNALAYEFAKINPIIVYCRPPMSTITNWGIRSQMNGVKENITKIIQQYDYMMPRIKSYGFDVLYYDYTDAGAFEVLIKLLKVGIKKRQSEVSNYDRERLDKVQNMFSKFVRLTYNSKDVE
jgi:hypothetical protein